MPTSPSVHHARSQRHEPPSTTGLGPNDFAFVAEVGVRWSDMDAFGHINHARMVTLMEEARIAWLLSAGEDYAPLITSAMIASGNSDLMIAEATISTSQMATMAPRIFQNIVVHLSGSDVKVFRLPYCPRVSAKVTL